MCMSLALVPKSRFEEGLELIIAINKDQIRQYKRIAVFLQYMRNQWLPLASILCVNESYRTNNGVESFHKNAFDQLGGNHPSIYEFLSKFIVSKTEHLKLILTYQCILK